MSENELPEDVQDAILDAELTADDKLVAEEQAKTELGSDESILDLKPSEESSEPREQPEEPVQGDPQSNGYTDYQLSRAHDLGFSEEEISSFESPGHLEYWMNKMDQQMLNRFQGYEQQIHELQRQPVEQPPQEPSPELPEDYKLQFDEYMDEGIAGNFKKLQAQVEEMQKYHADIATHEQEQVQIDNITGFEDAISELGDGYHSLLGTSSDERSVPNSEANKNASHLWEVFGQLQQISPNMTNEDLFRRAVGVSFPDFQVEQATRESQARLTDRLRDASGRFVARPSKRASSPIAPGEDSEWYESFDQMASERGWNTAPRMSVEELFDN